MTDKDKVAFDMWWHREANHSTVRPSETWQAACEYKDKSHINGSIMKQMNDEIESLKAENAKMRECLRLIATEDYRGNRSSGSVKAYLCLKELEEK